ncbi:MAG: hypothetical protein NZ528_10510 [Caldilineales bacterium]|nr:hypothetical protein [Caldilineales bacterium]MDW8318337.1 hypothetical protein [Anaerolineae bacterium]
MKKTRLFSLIGVALLLVLTALPAFAADPNPGSGNTDVVVVNTNQNTSASPADVTAVYYNVNGGIEYQRPVQINPRGQFIFRAADTTLGDNWIGSMVLQSDYELAAIAEITWTGGSSADGTTAGAYRGYAFGATTMYLPYIVRAPNAQFTRVTVQNTTPDTATIRMEYFNRDGVKDFTIDDTIPGLGSKTYAMNQPGGKVPDLMATSYAAARGNWTGGMKITSLNGKEIAAVATNHWQQYAVAYNGTSSGATRQFVPSVSRRYVDPPTISSNWREFTIINAQCLEASGSCAVKIEYFDAFTGNKVLELNRTIVAGAALGANTRAGGDFDPSVFNPLGNNFAGSAIVSTTNNTQIAVVVQSIRPFTNVAYSTSGANASEAGTETFLPAVYQRNTAGTSCAADAQWTTFSLIRIQNPTNNNANDVDIYYFNQNGSQALAQLNNTIQAGKSLNRNTRVMCNEITLGGNWTGSVYIRSDQPLVAVVENVWGNVKAMGYNGYSVTR